MRSALLLALALCGCLAVPEPDAGSSESPAPSSTRSSSPGPGSTQPSPGQPPGHVALVAIETSFNLTRHGNDTLGADYGLHCRKVQREDVEDGPRLRIFRWGERDVAWSNEAAVIVRYDPRSVQTANGTWHVGYNAALFGMDPQNGSFEMSSPLHHVQPGRLFNVTMQDGAVDVEGQPLAVGSSVALNRTYEVVHKETVFRFAQSFTVRNVGVLPVVYETTGLCI